MPPLVEESEHTALGGDPDVFRMRHLEVPSVRHVDREWRERLLLHGTPQLIKGHWASSLESRGAPAGVSRCEYTFGPDLRPRRAQRPVRMPRGPSPPAAIIACGRLSSVACQASGVPR